MWSVLRYMTTFLWGVYHLINFQELSIREPMHR